MFSKKLDPFLVIFFFVVAAGSVYTYLPFFVAPLTLVLFSKSLRASLVEFAKENYGSLRLDYNNNRDLYRSLWITIPLDLGMSMWFSKFLSHFYQDDYVHPVSSGLAFVFLHRVILAPVLEEIIVRKYVLYTLLRTHKYFLALMGSAILFSLPHGYNALGIFFGGLILGIYALRSGKLWLPTIMHATTNSFSFTLAAVFSFFQITTISLPEEIANNFQYCMAIFFLLLALLAIQLNRKRLDYTATVIRGKWQVDLPIYEPQYKRLIILTLILAVLLGGFWKLDEKYSISRRSGFLASRYLLEPDEHIRYRIVAIEPLQRFSSEKTEQLIYTENCRSEDTIEEMRCQETEYLLRKKYVKSSESLKNSRISVSCSIHPIVRYITMVLHGNLWSDKNSKGKHHHRSFNDKQRFIQINPDFNKHKSRFASVIFFYKKLTELTSSKKFKNEKDPFAPKPNVKFTDDARETELINFKVKKWSSVDFTRTAIPPELIKDCAEVKILN